MKETKYSTIASKISLSVCRLGLAVFLFLGVVLFIPFYHKNQAEVVRSIKTQGQLTVLSINETLNLYEQYAGILQNDASLAELTEACLYIPQSVKPGTFSMFLNGYLHTFSDLYSIGIILPDGQTYTDICSEMDLIHVRESNFYKEYHDSGKTRVLSLRTDGTCKKFGQAGDFFLMVYPYRRGGVSGDIVFCVPFKRIEEIVHAGDQRTDVRICDRSGEVLYAGGAGSAGVRTAGLGNGFTEEVSGGENVRFRSRIGGWTVLIHVPGHEILRRMYPVLLTYICFLLCMLLLLSVVIVRLRRMLCEIGTVIRHIDRITDGNDFPALDIRTGDELETLAEKFNEMMERIKSSIALQKEHELREQKMTYALAVAQINPHFIYKTLNTIIYLCQCGKDVQAVTVTRSLIGILKDRLRIDGFAVYDSVENELASVRAYISIQQVYYEDKIRFDTDVGDDLLQEQIPKNVIQPLIENAVFHGLLMNENEAGELIGGKLSLSVRRERDEIVISVSDSGCGIPDDKIRAVFYAREEQAAERGSHIGIRNIRYRLSHLPGMSCKLEAVSRLGTGTTVILRLRRIENEQR